VTVDGGSAQITALTPERVSQVDSGERTHIGHREEAGGNAISVVAVGSSTTTARCASRDVATSGECVTLATSTTGARKSIETRLASVASNDVAGGVLLRTEGASGSCAINHGTRSRRRHAVSALAVGILHPDLTGLAVNARSVLRVVVVSSARERS